MYGTLYAWECMESPGEKLQQILGGPGIRTQVPLDNTLTCLPTQPTRFIVSGTHNEYYIGNSIIMLEK